MKKSFWGYQAKEVDEAIDALTKQNTSLIQRNDHLEDELKNMHVQLEEMKANVAHSMTQAQFDEYKELKAAYAALQNRMQDEVDDSETVKELQAQLDAARQDAEKASCQEQAVREELQAQLDAAKQDAENASRQEQAVREELQAQLDAAKQDAEEAGRREQTAREELQAQLDAAKQDIEEVSALREEISALRLQAAEIPDDRELREMKQRYQEMLDDLQAARAGQREAQEEIQAVRAQQEELQGELRTARTELYGAKEEITAKDAELVRKDALLAGKDEELHQKDVALSEKDAELAQLKEQAAQPAFARQRDLGVVEINEMMKRVGDAIYETRTNTYRNMMGAVDDFTRQWEESNGQLEEILRDFDAEKDKTRQELLDTVQLILHQFDRMALKSDSMHANLQNLTAKRAELRDKLELTVEQLRSEPAQAKAEQPVVVGQEPEQLSSDSKGNEHFHGSCVSPLKKREATWFGDKKHGA